MWEGRSKDRREKSKYSEWECGDRSQDNLLICIPSHSGKQSTTGWICFLITLCLLSISLHSACSHLKKLSPARCPSLLCEDSWGHHDFAPCCCSVTLSSFGLKTGLGKWKQDCFPRWCVSEGKGKLIFSLRLKWPLETLVQGGDRPWDLGEQREGMWQVRAQSKAMWGRPGLAFASFSPTSLGNHVFACCYNHWSHVICLLY